MNSEKSRNYPADQGFDSTVRGKKDKLENDIRDLERKIRKGSKERKRYLFIIPKFSAIPLSVGLITAFVLPGISFLIFIISILIPTFLMSYYSLQKNGTYGGSERRGHDRKDEYRRKVAEYAKLLVDEKFSSKEETKIYQ